MQSAVSCKCGLCGTEYATEKEAINCEFGHKMPNRIVGRTWPQKKPLPEVIIRMTDGRKVLYRPVKEVK